MKVQFLTLTEVATLLGVARPTVVRAVTKGTFPAPIRVNSAMRFSTAAIAAWFEENGIDPETIEMADEPADDSETETKTPSLRDFAGTK